MFLFGRHVAFGRRDVNIKEVTMPENQAKVHKILCTPIVCKKGSGIKWGEVIDNLPAPDYQDPDFGPDTIDVIYTGQKYEGREDADMSDFAIGFYEILYQDILKDSILDDNGELKNQLFAGDTMNSFTSIANITPGAGESGSQKTPVTEWPRELIRYHQEYHCLANFWILPMELGRYDDKKRAYRCMKMNKYDSMDIFKEMLSKDYEIIANELPGYFEAFSSYKDFCSMHFIDSYLRKFPESRYEKSNWLSLIEDAQSDMYFRSMRIAESKYCDELLEYFTKLGLV